MLLLPAIDMLDHRAVRLRQGKRGDVTDYGSPVELAASFRDAGASWLHLVDLTAAFDGSSAHMPLIREVVRTFGGQVEVGGGIRSMADVEARMDAGVARCIIGTAAVDDPELVRQACKAYPGRIAVGIDAKNGLVATRGWVETAAVTAVDLAKRMGDLGVTAIIYTDVSRDGMMQGPNFPATQQLIAVSGLDIIGSGGVSSLDDLLRLRDIGCAGGILGRAMYEGAVSLQDALTILKED